ncbi:MAG: hypothetical protein AAB439_03230 [Patescibacteria group bacterium]
MKELLTRKNASLVGYAGFAGFGLYSIFETMLGNNEGMGSEGAAFLSLLVGLFFGQPKPMVHTGGGEKD